MGKSADQEGEQNQEASIIYLPTKGGMQTGSKKISYVTGGLYCKRHAHRVAGPLFRIKGDLIAVSSSF